MDILHTNAVTLPLTQLTPNEGQIVIDGERIAANPRYITDDEYAALKESIKADNLTGLNPLKVYEYKGQYVVIGGNMRLRAMRELGIEGTSCIIIPQDATAEVLRKEIITDNATFGKWDMDMLSNEWNEDKLREWGVDVPPAIDESALDDLFEDDNTAKKDKGSAFTVEIPKCYEEVIEDIKSALAITLSQWQGCSIK